jgi:hypothetical protein
LIESRKKNLLKDQKFRIIANLPKISMPVENKKNNEMELTSLPTPTPNPIPPIYREPELETGNHIDTALVSILNPFAL